MISGLLGLGIGYLSLRLQGVFFSIATLALTVVLHTIMINWEFVGGAKGISILRPVTVLFCSNYVKCLFAAPLPVLRLSPSDFALTGGVSQFAAFEQALDDVKLIL